jgi:o-succinylbenzoate synthase
MSLHFYTYNSPFTSEFIQAKGSMGSSREGILIEWKHLMGSAWGECAPLPGFSSESLKDCERMLVSHKKKLEEQLHLLQAHLPKEKSNSRLFFDYTYAQHVADLLYSCIPTNFPSIQFALSMMLYDWGSQRENLPLYSLVRDHAYEVALVYSATTQTSTQMVDSFSSQKNHEAQIPINALIPIASPEESLTLSQKAWSEGIKTIKMKVGPKHQENLNRLTVIQDNLPGMKYRLDPNGKWESESLKFYQEDYRRFSIEYIEQAVAPNTLTNFCLELTSEAPAMAADESSVDFSSFTSLLGHQHISYFVLKPTLSGGIPEMIQRCVMAREKGQTCIFSSAFDGIIARYTLATLAWMSNQLTGHNLAHGLDTGRWLIEDYRSPERSLVSEIQEGMYSLNATYFDDQPHNTSPEYSNKVQHLGLFIERNRLTPIIEQQG